MEEDEVHVLSRTFGPNRRGWMFDKRVGGIGARTVIPVGAEVSVWPDKRMTMLLRKR